MAKVSQRGGTWQASVMVDGKRIRKAFKSEAEAHQFIREVEAKAVLGMPVEVESSRRGSTIQEVFDLTERDCWSGKKSESSLIHNGQAAVDYFGFETLMKAIDERRINEWADAMKKLGHSNATVNRKLAALSKMFSHAVRLRLVDRKPYIKREREPVGRIRYLTQSEEDMLLGRFRHLGYVDYADLCVVLLDTGARVGEILKVTWQDVNGRMLHLWDTKNGSSRSVPLTVRAAEVLSNRNVRSVCRSVSIVLQPRLDTSEEPHWHVSRRSVCAPHSEAYLCISVGSGWRPDFECEGVPGTQKHVSDSALCPPGTEAVVERYGSLAAITQRGMRQDRVDRMSVTRSCGVVSNPVSKLTGSVAKMADAGHSKCPSRYENEGSTPSAPIQSDSKSNARQSTDARVRISAAKVKRDIRKHRCTTG